MSNGFKVLIYLSLYLSASISRIVDSNPLVLHKTKANLMADAEQDQYLPFCRTPFLFQKKLYSLLFYFSLQNKGGIQTFECQFFSWFNSKLLSFDLSNKFWSIFESAKFYLTHIYIHTACWNRAFMLC